MATINRTDKTLAALRVLEPILWAAFAALLLSYLLSGCGATADTVRVDSFGGEGHVELEVDPVGRVRVELGYEAIERAGDYYHCPVLDLTVGTVRLRGTLPDADPVCVERIGVLRPVEVPRPAEPSAWLDGLGSILGAFVRLGGC